MTLFDEPMRPLRALSGAGALPTVFVPLEVTPRAGSAICAPLSVCGRNADPPGPLTPRPTDRGELTKAFAFVLKGFGALIVTPGFGEMLAVVGLIGRR